MLDAVIPVVALVFFIGLTIALFGTDATGGPLQVALLMSALVAALVALKNGYTVAYIRGAAFGGISSGMSALFILLAVGSLIGTWNMAGTIPTVVYIGLDLLSPTWFYPATAIVCGLVGLAIGSSWTTAATLGVAFVALAPLVGASPVIAAGAVISGAYFGDKMTPISETTVLVPTMVGNVTTNQHIGAMVWTSVPAVVIALVGFTFLGLTTTATGAGFDTDAAQASLAAEFNISLDQPPAAGPARGLLDPEGAAVRRDLRLRALRRGPRLLHPARGRRGVRRLAGPGTPHVLDRGDLRGDGDRLRLRHRQRDGRRALLAGRDARRCSRRSGSSWEP